VSALPQCNTCRFFGRPNGLDWWDEATDTYGETKHHNCVRIIHGNGGGSWTRQKTAVEPAVVTDGSGYAASLRVLPTFGCSLHESKGQEG
jgi:hypothetical protein